MSAPWPPVPPGDPNPWAPPPATTSGGPPDQPAVPAGAAPAPPPPPPPQAAPGAPGGYPPAGAQPAPAAGGYPAQPGAGGYYPAMPKTSTNAIVALVLAIASFVVCPVVPAIVALVMAGPAQREIEASRGWVTGEGLVTAARIIAWINIGIAVVVIAGFLLVGCIATVSSSSNGMVG